MTQLSVFASIFMSYQGGQDAAKDPPCSAGFGVVPSSEDVDLTQAGWLGRV